MMSLLAKKHDLPRGKRNWSPERPAPEVVRSRPPGILVVAGDAWVWAVMNRGLRREGFTVWLAANGLQGQDLYMSNCERIDLVLLDTSLSDADRRQTLAALQRFNPAVRCCFMDVAPHSRGEDGLLEGGTPSMIGTRFAISKVTHLLRRLAKDCSPQEQADSPALLLDDSPAFTAGAGWKYGSRAL